MQYAVYDGFYGNFIESFPTDLEAIGYIKGMLSVLNPVVPRKFLLVRYINSVSTDYEVLQEFSN